MSGHHVGFGINDPFDIDGELDGVTPQVAFVLGVEFTLFRATLDGCADKGDHDGWSQWVRKENALRLQRLARRRGRHAVITTKETKERVLLTIHPRIRSVS